VGHGVGQGKAAKINTPQKLQKQKKSRQNQGIPAGFWSCYPDLNWGPHPYQLPRQYFLHIFRLFIAVFALFYLLSGTL
jgi:hypothetical protein